MKPLSAVIAAMPKAELHMHLEGSIEPELSFRLAEKNGIRLRYRSIEELRAAYDFPNLQGFLDVYYAGTSVLLDEQDFYDLAWAYLQRARADHIVRAEVFLGPQAHTVRGVPFDVMMRGVVRALDDGAARLGVSAALIVNLLRHKSEEDGFATLERTLAWRDRVIGIGLGGAELGNPPRKFKRLFARCRELGFRVMAHAGEEGPAGYVRDAVDVLKVDRIDHGVRCEEDPALVRRLAALRVPLTVCPLSNVKLKVFPRLADHNLKRLLRAGLRVTINSDDPSYFGGYLGDNYTACVQALGLTAADVYRLARNGFSASFLSEDEKRAHLAALDACWRSHGYDPRVLMQEAT
jgi:adenosine deaminase